MNPPNKLIIQSGSKYGKLTVIEEAPKMILPSGQTNRAMKCQCDCGKTTVVRLLNLVRLRTISCGCINPRHGYSNSKLYRVWKGMLDRTSINGIDAHRYFHRGIGVCNEWRKFIPFKDWAISNGYDSTLQIDRIDNSKGYSPDNCRFVSVFVNANNRDVTLMVDYDRQKQPLKMILHSKGINNYYHTIIGRIKRGWSAQDAIDTPIRKGNYANRWKTMEGIQ